MKLSAAAREIVSVIRRHRLNYDTFRKAAYEARRSLHMKPKGGGTRLPQLIPQDALKRFYDVVDKAGNLQHQIMLRLLLYAGVRAAELAAIRVEDVDLEACKVFIRSGKGDKDRYVLVPDRFRLALQAHLTSIMKSDRGRKYLFESRLRDKFSVRSVENIVQQYAEAAEMPVKVHPHLFRHQMISYLTSEGLSDAQIQLVSGHASKKSLERYQQISLQQVGPDYQAAMRKVDI